MGRKNVPRSGKEQQLERASTEIFPDEVNALSLYPSLSLFHNTTPSLFFFFKAITSAHCLGQLLGQMIAQQIGQTRVVTLFGKTVKNEGERQGEREIATVTVPNLAAGKNNHQALRTSKNSIHNIFDNDYDAKSQICFLLRPNCGACAAVPVGNRRRSSPA